MIPGWLNALWKQLANALGVDRLLGTAEMDTWRQQLEAKEAELAALDIESANALAEKVLGDPARFRCADDPVDEFPHYRELASGMRALFRKYRSVEAVHGDFRLSRADIAPSCLRDGVLTIGSDVEHSEIVVLPGEETVYCIDGMEPEETWRDDRQPSIYHWILLIDFICHEDRDPATGQTA